VLVEMGFLTNAQDEQRLAADDQQAALVQGLLDGILRYRSTAGTR
jgi:N-acetylmuramoyl-L-alanine amidase